MKYKITVETGNLRGAGPYASVSIKLTGKNGTETKKSSLVKIFNNDFARVETDIYELSDYDVGDVVTITLNNDGKAVKSDWFIAKVIVEKEIEGQTKKYEFPCYCWVVHRLVVCEGKADVPPPSSGHPLPPPEEIRWEKKSIKHRSKLSELETLLKTEPSKATKIGTCWVCFDDKFSIGKGGDGTKVYVGLSDDGYEVAIKCINLKNCHQMGENERNILNFPQVQDEKHIINYRYYHDPVDTEKAYLVLDLHEQTLQDYVKSEDRSVEKLREEGPRIIRQILSGVKALHCGTPEILHRDLKPSNIFVNVRGKMLLADFGISRTLSPEQTTYKSGVSGTDGWMAAESLPTDDDDDDDLSYEEIQVRYKKQSDIQVVGMLCYYILTKGKHPYGGRIHRSSNISKGNFNLKDVSDPCARDLIIWMLQHDPTERPNVHECLNHPFLRTAEENFKFITRVGNEREIKTKDSTSIIVQELNKLRGFTNWLAMADSCVIKYMNVKRPEHPYTNNVADLLRFIRNMEMHWRDEAPPADVRSNVVKPQEYFEKTFPTLAVELHRIIRGYSNWTTRDALKEFFPLS